MTLSFLVFPITFFVGFLLGRKIHGTVGIAASVVAGAAVYIAGLIGIAGAPSVLTFNLLTQILMAAFGALASVFGWFIGVNLELLIKTKSR
ncbi:hypothetical protein CW712_04805 [Candidatus Bathyarchaeota archaeon]|nr:MAG: hypothetical protein CW712_04805 [Candidatus Bathyarchaeota archaeon]